MTADIDGSPYQHGDPVTIVDPAAANGTFLFVEKTGHWVEITPPDSAVGFTVHQEQVER